MAEVGDGGDEEGDARLQHVVQGLPVVKQSLLIECCSFNCMRAIGNKELPPKTAFKVGQSPTKLLSSSMKYLTYALPNVEMI